MEQTDARVTGALQEAGYEVRSYSGLMLREPAEVRLDMGSGRWVGHFGTLSPFLKCAFTLPQMQCTCHACYSRSWLRKGDVKCARTWALCANTDISAQDHPFLSAAHPTPIVHTDVTLMLLLLLITKQRTAGPILCTAITSYGVWVFQQLGLKLPALVSRCLKHVWWLSRMVLGNE